MNINSDEARFWLRVGSLSLSLEHYLQVKGMYFRSSFMDDIALQIVSNKVKQDAGWYKRRLIGIRIFSWKLKCKLSWYLTRISWKLTS